MAKIYTQEDYDKITDLYNEYANKKDSYTPEQQEKIENAFNDARNQIQQSMSEKHIVDMYGTKEEPGLTYTHYNDGSVSITGKSNQDIAKEVIQGKWGNGSARKAALEQAGYDYNTIQSIVNGSSKGSKPKMKEDTPPAAPEQAEIPAANPAPQSRDPNMVYPVASHASVETYPAGTMMSDGTVVPASFNASAYPVATVAGQRTVPGGTIMSDGSVVPASFNTNATPVASAAGGGVIMSDGTVFNGAYPVATAANKVETYPAGTRMSDGTVFTGGYPVGTAAGQRVVADGTLMSDGTVVPASFVPGQPAYAAEPKYMKTQSVIAKPVVTNPKVNLLLDQGYSINNGGYLVNPMGVSLGQRVI